MPELDDWSVISALLDEALELDADERAGWLAALRGERAGHRDRLARLLGAVSESSRGDFLGSPPRLEQPIRSGAAPKAGETVGPYTPSSATPSPSIRAGAMPTST